MERLVNAVNNITTQVWAFLILVSGIGSIILFHRNGIDVGIGAGIIGAGLNMFQTQAKAGTTQIQSSGPTTGSSTVIETTK